MSDKDDMKELKLEALTYYIVKNLSHRLNRTKLVKLLFITDMVANEELGHTITGIEYKYLLYGPYSDDIMETVDFLNNFEIKEEKNEYSGSYSYLQGINPRFEPEEILTEDEIRLATKIIIEYGFKSLREILDYVYNLDIMKNAVPLDVVLK